MNSRVLALGADCDLAATPGLAEAGVSIAFAHQYLRDQADRSGTAPAL